MSSGRSLAGLLALVCVGLTACSGDAASTSEAGRGASPPASSAPAKPQPLQVRWTIATNDGPDTPTGVAIARLSTLLHETSRGTMLLVPAWEAAGETDDWDQAAAKTVIDGDHQLGLVPARAFDALEVSSLQALQTPSLLTSTARVRAVVASSLSDELMGGLDAIGLTGLALYPEDVRRVFSYDRPLMTPGALSGTLLRAPHSRMTDAAFDSVGASTSDVQGDAWDAAVASGELDGVESSFAGIVGLGSAAGMSTATNQPLFPKVNVLVVAREAFEGLEDDQRTALRRAAVRLQREARDWPGEADAAREFCAAGGRAVRASADDVRALHDALSATEPPADEARTRQLADQIAELVAGLPATDPVQPC